MSISWYFLFCLGFCLASCAWCFFLFDILFFFGVIFGLLCFFLQLSGAFLPVRVWAVQMGDKKYVFFFVYRVRG